MTYDRPIAQILPPEQRDQLVKAAQHWSQEERLRQIEEVTAWLKAFYPKLFQKDPE